MSNQRRAAPMPTTTPLLTPAGQPLLKPTGAGLAFGGRREEEQVSGVETPEGDTVASRDRDATVSPERAPRPGAPRRRTTGSRPAPRVADAVAMTVRFDPAEALEIDLQMLTLKEETGASRLDKSEVIRELLRLAREHDGVRRTLVRRLSRPQGGTAAHRRTTPES
ncbi:hypothetical protein [Kitasatospora acidiphila]|uniref:hypothetical protein n=1 Tax=Kitasatospora acidiphila TaxID=2567942 RepID=UPI003C729279